MIEFVLPSEEFSSFFVNDQKPHFMVSKYSEDFGDLSNFMKRELGKLDSSENLVINNSAQLNKRLGKRRSKVKVYFTEIKDGFFICEVLSHWDKRGKLRPHYVQGLSYLYLFRVDKNRQVVLEHIKGMANN